MCEGAIEGVVELSFFSCYFSSCLLGLMCLLYLFPSKLFASPEVVVLSCGVVLYNLFFWLPGAGPYRPIRLVHR